MNWQKLYNPMMALILRSPLHGLLSRSVMLITVTGRKSGRPITTPVNYVQDDATLIVISQKDRQWWRNVKANPGVTLYLRGKAIPATGQLIDQPGEAAGALRALFRLAPQYARYFGVALGEGGEPLDEDALRQAAEGRVLMTLTLHDTRTQG